MSDLRTSVEIPGVVLERIIGRGATSLVWAGRDEAGEAVAVKVPHAGSDSLDLAQSAAERQVLTAVHHDHLVNLRAVVPLPDGRVATVFDLVDGASLRATVEARGHLRPGETVTVVMPVCQALAALHRAGATHGDISPGNILVTADGRPLLADLGGARVVGSGRLVVGTPGFVAPEVLGGEAPTMASDVYAIGAIAWYCIAGSPPPRSPIRLDPQAVVSEVGPELAEFVATCIDPEPAQRPASERLAQLVYEASPAEPIEVVVGADETSNLTHRLRMNAVAAEETSGSTGKAPRVGVRHLLTRSRDLPELRGPRTGWSPPTLARMVVVAMLVIGAALGVSVRAADGDRQPLEATQRPRQSSTQTTLAAVERPHADGSAPATQPVDVDVTTDPLAPQRSAEALLRLLAKRRTRCLVARDTQALDGVHRSGSPSWQADAALLTDLERRGQRYVGLDVAAVQATTLSFAAGRAVVRARVDLTEYAIVSSSGERVSRPGAPGRDLDFTLVRTAAGWRIESISERATT